jgi:hypothetical protein
MTDATRALVERLAGHPGIGESSRTAPLTVVGGNGWRIDEASRNPTGPVCIYLGRGEQEAAEAEYEVVWTRGDAHVLLLRCNSHDAESFLLTAEAERELLTIWRKRAVAEEPKERRMPGTHKNEFSEKLAAAIVIAARRHVGGSRAELSRRSGVDRAQMARVENVGGSHAGLSWASICLLAQAVGLTPSALISEAEDIAVLRAQVATTQAEPAEVSP